jgi:hypothetical protein
MLKGLFWTQGGRKVLFPPPRRIGAQSLVEPDVIRSLTFTRAQAAGVEVMRAIDLRVTLVDEGFLGMTFARAQAAGVEAMRDIP